MSRTKLCLITAAVLALGSVAAMIARRQVLGDEVRVPAEPDTWKVTLRAQARSVGEARLLTVTPLDFGRQHILGEAFRSEELVARPPDLRHPERREVIWTQRAGPGHVPVGVHYEFYCSTNVRQPTAAMTELASKLYAKPAEGEHLRTETGIESDHAEVAALARRLTEGLDRPTDQTAALFRHVSQDVGNEPTVAGPPATAVGCLALGSGDSAAKSRLLAALCRNLGIPARLVTGLALAQGREQTAHVWVEAWVRGHWLPMCPFFHHYGKLPPGYLIFGLEDLQLVRGRNVRGLDFGFLVEQLPVANSEAVENPGWARWAFTACSFHGLPPAEQRLVEFLLLLPLAALVVCFFRVVVGLQSFGTFSPALLGLCFRQLRSLPGVVIFVAIVLVGWLMRKVLDRYHLLQVPRIGFLLTLVVLVLMAAIVGANHLGLPATNYIALFPMVILTGMIERFWTLEAEDGTAASFRTLGVTLLIAGVVSLCVSWTAVTRYLYHFPETLGLVLAAHLLLGRYTGYRITELYRFRDFLKAGPKEEPILQMARLTVEDDLPNRSGPLAV